MNAAAGCFCLVFLSPHAGKLSRDSGTSHEQQYVRQVIELHDKYLAYVSTCFANSSLFHKALKEAFEGFCNKNVAGSTSAELMANFCDNLLKKVQCLINFLLNLAAACCMGLGANDCVFERLLQQECGGQHQRGAHGQLLRQPAQEGAVWSS
jgi:hypothetical protein